MYIKFDIGKKSAKFRHQEFRKALFVEPVNIPLLTALLTKIEATTTTLPKRLDILTTALECQCKTGFKNISMILAFVVNLSQRKQPNSTVFTPANLKAASHLLV